jgi:NAD(P)-dependent dehydrogenase (short-subunit alcohol dehydrogenase family)
MSSAGKVAIVTGGSSGVGRATCIALAREGFHITVVGTSSERINETLNVLNSSTTDKSDLCHLGLRLDVTKEADMQEMVSKAMERFGRIDLLVASAGIGKSSRSDRIIPHSTASLPLEEWNELLDVNLTGVFLSNRAVLPVMMAQKIGHIINVGSSNGLRGRAYIPAYAASKFGVTGFTESLAEEVCTYGIRVQVLFLHLVATGLLAAAGQSRRSEPVMSPQSVAASIVYLVQQPLDAVVVHPHLIPFGVSW